MPELLHPDHITSKSSLGLIEYLEIVTYCSVLVIHMTGWIERHQHKCIPVKVSLSDPCHVTQYKVTTSASITLCYEIFPLLFPLQCWMNTFLHPPQCHYTTVKKEETVLIAAGIRSLLFRTRISFFTQEKTHKHLT